MVNGRFTRQFWVSLGIIAASIIIAAGVLVFLSGDISTQAAAIATDRAVIETRTSAVANLAQLEADAPRAAQYQTEIDQVLPGQYGLITFGQWFSQRGEAYSVTANAALQGSIVSAASTTPGTAQFSFTAQGSQSNLTAFLNGMNATSSGFLIALTSFDMTNSGTNEQITGQGTVFFQ